MKMLALAVVLLAGCGGAQRPDTCNATRTACDACAASLAQWCDEDSVAIAESEARGALCAVTASACMICETAETEHCE